MRHGDRDPVRIDVKAARDRHGVEICVRDHGGGYDGNPRRLSLSTIF